LTHALNKVKPKDCNSPSKYAMNARDAIMQKLQEYSNESEKMLSKCSN
jgi:sugar-specific transcriptional regulator TrmB